MTVYKKIIIAGVIVLTLSLGACSDDETSTSTFKGCRTTNTIGAGVPTWIANNFICADVSISSGTITVTTTDQPPYSDFYWSDSDSYHSTAGQPSSTDLGFRLVTQNVVMTFPESPTTGGADLISPGVSGITIHGVAFFNNEAASPDTLADEFETMDTLNSGHVNSAGFYHHHTEPLQISNNDSNLIGVARDGFPVFGRKEEDGSIPFSGDGLTVNYHSHAVDTANAWGFDGATTTHYHAVDSDFETTSDGESIEISWMIGPVSTTFAGAAGTVTGGP